MHKLERNIWLCYGLSVCKNAWFWLGVWVFYYLQFTNYAGIGILETVMIVTMTLSEVPTGAIADLLGKRKTLIMAMLLLGLSNIWMGYVPSVFFLGLSIILASLATAFFSGTFDAILYDTLENLQQGGRYSKILANARTIGLISPAVCGAIGGYLFTLNDKLPYLASGGVMLIGAVLAYFLVEPTIDTFRFNWTNFWRQLGLGFHQLTLSPAVIKQTLLLLSIGSIVVIFDEMLNVFVGLEFGFSEQAMGVLFAALYLVSAISVQLAPWLSRRWGSHQALVITGFFLVATMVVTPWLGILLGGLTLFMRTSGQSITEALTVTVINEKTESNVRATTISSFNMIKNLPYVVGAFGVGILSDAISAKWTTAILGLLLLGLLLIQWKQKNSSASGVTSS